MTSSQPYGLFRLRVKTIHKNMKNYHTESFIEKSNYKTFKTCISELKPYYQPNPDVPRAQICSSQSASEYIRQIFPVQITYREAFIVLFLNRANNTVGWSMISIGGVSGTIADPKMIFSHALLSNASGILIAHNHPSGNLKPSEADKRLTEKIAKGAKLLDISLLDHIILTEEGYFSFADSGELP